ncbi:nicotinate-nucleotide diphosphorylase (carboxylating) [Rubrobacter xylanophilus]|uniref:Nicotinate-nucleotide pyrophosphorylase [carboxylating] n=1 Tax=Rubrobacter xylanophilus TaxID=49319 RepID=A0A510HK29_9ACTN|nr:carboxylating nicotinate-nucleotide diphosphorylase [Rubrobacter xylanophilus]BBL80376.1 nicotinate-nucleotide diphosphorylase (carboxylating) [Rubrobacter xylanophilus]
MEQRVGVRRPPEALLEVARRALGEDLGRGDITSEAAVPPGVRARGRFIARRELVVSGLAAAAAVFHEAGGGEVEFLPLAAEGEAVGGGVVLAEVAGPAREVLAAERVALNLLMRLCGVATLTRRYVAAVEGTGARIADTRKTTPGLRALEKAAVRAGGGVNHRFGLDDGILLKDNHLALAGGVAEAVRRARAAAPHLLKIEVEVESERELREALAAGADAVLLDNMSPEQARRCVRLVRGERPGVVVEVSGGVDLGTVRAYAEAGADLISVGALTHSAPAADISLEVEPC